MIHQGYTYDYWLDDDGDVRKRWHEIRRPDGTTVEWDLMTPEFRSWSPYSEPSRAVFEQCVEHVRFFDFIGVDNKVN